MGSGAILRIEAARSQLHVIRKFIADQSASIGISEMDMADLVQAVDEAATNTIVHGYHDQKGPIEIEFLYQPGQVKVILRDWAPTFNPDDVQPIDLSLPLDQRPTGHMGLHLIRKCVDEFMHQTPANGGNELIFVKYLGKPV